MKTHDPRRATHDLFGFRFWLAWILWFAGALILAVIFWTLFIQRLFGAVRGYELTLTWSLAVFGSWFLLLIPFMRKKEQIWKRLNVDQERALDAWLAGMGLFIGLLMASALFWSLRFRANLADTRSFHPEWLRSVLGSWLFLALPFLVVMYRSADRIFKTALLRQTQTGPRFRSIFIERSHRILSHGLAEKLGRIPETMEGAHLVHLLLKDGRRIPNVFILNRREILGVYDRTELGFDLKDAADLEAVRPLPVFEESKWLRLDGRA